MKKILIISILVLSLFLVNAGCTEDQTTQPTEDQTLQQQIKDLQQQLKLKDQQLEKYQPQKVTSLLNLKSWSEDEIIEAFKDHNLKFEEDSSWFEYKYDQGDNYYYDIEGPIFQDPFTKLAYKPQAREWNTNQLRIFDLGYDNLDLANGRYNKYKEEIVKVQIRLDEQLSCVEQLGCRDIQILQCKKGTSYYYSWFAERYLFVTRNDDGDTLKTFKEIYCIPQQTGLTGITAGVVKNLGLKTSSLINFFKSII